MSWLIVLSFATNGLGHAARPNPVPDHKLIGDWQDEGGSLLLELRADHSAVFTVPTLRKGETSEPRLGRFYVKDALWVLEVSGIDKRLERYQIVSLDSNTVNLLGRNEAKLTLYRVGVRFEQLDRNRDGLLDLSEVENTRLRLHFADIDANKDGQLTPAELVTYWRRFPPPVVIQR